MDTEKSQTGEVEGEARKLTVLVVFMSMIVVVIFSFIPAV